MPLFIGCNWSICRTHGMQVVVRDFGIPTRLGREYTEELECGCYLTVIR